MGWFGKKAGNEVACVQCGERCTVAPAHWVLVDGQRLPVCCAGCAAVFNLISSLGHVDDHRIHAGTGN